MDKPELNTVISWLEGLTWDDWSDYHSESEVQNIAKSALELLKEKKHGEWITLWDRNDPDTSSAGRCSVCGRVSGRPLGKYCRWCGSVMDKE